MSLSTPHAQYVPLDILSHLCAILLDHTDTHTLAHIARTSIDIRNIALPALYRRITFTSDNTAAFFSPKSSNLCSSWRYTTHLQISSIPPDPISFPLSTSPLFPQVRSIILDSQAIWQLIVYSHTHHSPHPLITFLQTHTSPRYLTIQYPNKERTAHSFGGGYCCCLAAVRAFQQNPLRAAAFDRSSTSRLISELTSHWGQLEVLNLEGVVDDEIPEDVACTRLEVVWDACQCADPKFHGEWCFNHVSPGKRVEQVRKLLATAVDKGTVVSMEGVERVGGTCEDDDVGKWIEAKLKEVRSGEGEGASCCFAGK